MMFLLSILLWPLLVISSAQFHPCMCAYTSLHYQLLLVHLLSLSVMKGIRKFRLKKKKERKIPLMEMKIRTLWSRIEMQLEQIPSLPFSYIYIYAYICARAILPY